MNVVKLCKKTIREYVVFLDQRIHSFLRDQTVDKDLCDLVKLCQTYQHSKSLGKYKSKPCICNFNRFFTGKTIVVLLLAQSVGIRKVKKLTKHNNTSLKVN